jgi:hypothetical protein
MEAGKNYEMLGVIRLLGKVLACHTNLRPTEACLDGGTMTPPLRSVIAQIEQEFSPEEQDELARQLEDQFIARRAVNTRQQQLEALARLAELTKDLPPVDAVELVRQGREELERRALR